MINKRTTITYVTVVLKLIMIYILLLHFLKDINANTYLLLSFLFIISSISSLLNPVAFITISLSTPCSSNFLAVSFFLHFLHD